MKWINGNIALSAGVLLFLIALLRKDGMMFLLALSLIIASVLIRFGLVTPIRKFLGEVWGGEHGTFAQRTLWYVASVLVGLILIVLSWWKPFFLPLVVLGMLILFAPPVCLAIWIATKVFFPDFLKKE